MVSKSLNIFQGVKKIPKIIFFGYAKISNFFLVQKLVFLGVQNPQNIFLGYQKIPNIFFKMYKIQKYTYRVSKNPKIMYLGCPKIPKIF